MALVVRNAAPLKPEIRLAQALSEFETNLNAEHKAAFRNARAVATKTPPTPSDVMRLTAEIDSRVRREHGPSRCFGPRLTNILQAVQQFAALGDTVVGGSQNIVACGVWSAVRMMLHMAIGYASYLEKLSLLFMTAGRQAPRYQALAIIYPHSKDLQNNLFEYFIVIVHICQKIQQYGKKSAFGQLKSSLNDADLKEYQSDLEAWGNSIKDEAMLLLNQKLQNESQENEKARALVSKWSISSTQRQQALERIERIERKVRWLDACSKYDFQTTWKQIRKRGSTSLLPTWPEYQRWKHKGEMPSAILFSGKVGAGKSVTLANIIDDLYLSGDTIVVYFFCRHDIPKSLISRTILGSLARQYLSHFPENHAAFKEDVPTLDLEELSALMKPRRDGRLRYLLIDGLDECSIEERSSVLTQMSWLQKESDWRLGLSARLSAENLIGEQIALSWRVSLPINNPDIERYIDSELEARLANGQLKVGDYSLVSEIRVALLSGANGMFLWVALQLDQICLELSDHSIRLAIKSLPRDLSEMYSRILKNSAARDTGRYHARLFKFLAAAYVPLTVDQIQEMASVSVGDPIWDPTRCINDILKALGFCGSLVMIEEEEQTVRFVHHSARSFCQGVLSGFNRWENCFSDEEAHREMGATAVTYLSYGIFDTRLSTQVIPKVDVGKVPDHIVQQTLGTAKSMSRLALSFVKAKQDRNRDIGHVLARVKRQMSTGESETISPPFLPYAKKFWILHTRSIRNPVVRELWERLFDEVNIHDLQMTPHVLGPLDNFKITCKHSLAPAFLWAINYSHTAMFDRLMDLQSDYDEFSTKRPWDRFRFFYSLLKYLHRHIQNSFTKGPCLEPQMIQRLLPLAVTLRVHRMVEWMVSCVDSTDVRQAFEVAVSCGNFKSAAVISTNPAFRNLKEVVLPSELLTIAASYQDAQMVSLLVKVGAARSADVNAATLSSVLCSDMHQAPLLRIIFSLAMAGIRPEAIRQTHLSGTFQLLALSPEINAATASRVMMRILKAASDFPRLHQLIMNHACSIGSFELSNVVWLSYYNVTRETRKVSLGKRPGFPFKGNELSLVLRTVSTSRIKLANWLVRNGYQDKELANLRRALMLRNWELADTLLNGTNFAKDALRFCTEHELFHVCVVEGDLIGIDFLLKIGMSFKEQSSGPMFKSETSLQALMSQHPDCSIHISFADLCRRDAFAATRMSPGFASIKAAMENLILRNNASTWNPDIRKIARERLERGVFSENYNWFVCTLAAVIRKVVRAYFIPLDSDAATGLDHLENWLELLKEMLHSDLTSPDCGEQEGTLVLREIFSIASALDETITAVKALWGSFPPDRLEAQMRLWQFIDLFIDWRSQGRNGQLSRPGALQELSSLICQRPLKGIFQDSHIDALRARERVYKALCLADTNLSLPWILQYLFTLSQGVSISEFCRLSAHWEHMVRSTNISKDTREAFKFVGWTEGDLEEWMVADEHYWTP